MPAPGAPYEQGDFDDVATLGANVVNISRPGLFAEALPYTVDLDVQTHLD
ncbi:MAG: hypothetical protein ACOC7Y_03260 [Chloroflexota bacterium]